MAVFNSKHTEIFKILIIGSCKPVRASSSTPLNRAYVFISLDSLYITKIIAKVQRRKKIQSNTVKNPADNELDLRRNLGGWKNHEID